MNTKINEAINEILNQFGDKYIINSQINKSKVLMDLENYDKGLLEKFLSNEIIKNNFSLSIEGNTIIQINKLKEVFEADEYWQDSFTKYSKKIGLTTNGRFLDEETDVVLDFPYKDTVLKASMSREDTYKNDLRPNEPFLNEIIAKEEIDVLLDKKILINAKKYDSKGSHEINEFVKDDNLIIKGNNLLALHMLRDKFAGKIKLIYIDPPYNTGNDSFDYNDKFSVSSWLVFMKNRLEIAKDLLTEDGLIFVHIDISRTNSNNFVGTSMQPYLHVLMDNIFGRENYIATLHWKKKKQPSYLSRVAVIMESILVFSKNEKTIKKLSIENSTDKTKRVDNASNPVSERIIKKGIEFKGKEKDVIIPRGTYKNKSMEVIYLDDLIIKNGITQNDIRVKGQWRTSQENISKFVEEKLLYITSSFTFRRYATEDELKNEKAITDLLLDWGQNQDATNEIEELFGNKNFGTPKPEKLLSNIIKSHTKEGDIVLDFFMGSGTTQAVAHKMNRQYIGIEQMDYINSVAVPRLQKVIEGEQGGVSKEVDWQGGGSFVYVELMEKNRGFLKAIENSETQGELFKVFEFMINESDIDFKIDLEKVKNTIHELTFLEQKKLLIKIIDKNQLYYNYSEINDGNVRDLMSENDYEFNNHFYEKRGED
ncbi:site-specific DNA-methyltransferase [Macrococcoides canis]|uniref:site-specific DNA-methyltransferase n=1 Tax=Macrococcoides canis TaxID=1855823 RepID=UPI00105E1051|nr:site-specific DNA-methyltransferase [Macrococcus canis]TDM32124.1 site-specific DNA-methyltransferase [Macrococcus canis]